MTAASYALLRSLGKCTHCGHRDAMEDPKTGDPMCLCGICAEDSLAFTAERKARRLAAGQCPHCGGEPSPGYKTCAAWREADRRYHKRRYPQVGSASIPGVGTKKVSTDATLPRV